MCFFLGFNRNRAFLITMLDMKSLEIRRFSAALLREEDTAEQKELVHHLRNHSWAVLRSDDLVGAGSDICSKVEVEFEAFFDRSEDEKKAGNQLPTFNSNRLIPNSTVAQTPWE